VISCHLGGSSSLCEIRDGKSIDTSFGLSLQSGILHLNRCGGIDAFMLPYVREKLGLSYEELFRELAPNAGLKGISGMEGDLKEIDSAAEKGNPLAELAVKKFVYDVLRYVGGYIVAIGGLDALAFTGGDRRELDQGAARGVPRPHLPRARARRDRERSGEISLSRRGCA
jgi:acetate kinase